MADEHRRWAEGASDKDFAAMEARVSARASIQKQWLSPKPPTAARQQKSHPETLRESRPQTFGHSWKDRGASTSRELPGRRLLAKIYTADQEREGSPVSKAREMDTRRTDVLTSRWGVDCDPTLLNASVAEEGPDALLEELSKPGPASVKVWEAKNDIYTVQREQMEQDRLQSLVSNNDRAERDRWFAAESLRAGQRRNAHQKKAETRVRSNMAAKLRNQNNANESIRMKLPVLKRSF
jgi:hypothetical protein